MRYMIIIKATDESEAETSPVGEEALLVEMVNYHEQLSKAGVLLDGSGLKPSSQGWRIYYDGDKRTVVDGPFAETKELIAGYTLLQVKIPRRSHGMGATFSQPSGPWQSRNYRSAAAVRNGRFSAFRSHRPFQSAVVKSFLIQGEIHVHG